MKPLLLLSAALLSLSTSSCSSSNSSDPDAGPPIEDIDAEPPREADCNPVTQAGCEAGERCAQVVESDEPFLARTSCIPDGSVAIDQACTPASAQSPNGADDCLAGTHCLNGACAEICSSGPIDSCREEDEGFADGSYCTAYEDTFAEGIGLCVAACDPLDDSVVEGKVVSADCADTEGCFVNLSNGTAACGGVPAPAAQLSQNEACFGPAGSGACYTNGCASGFAPILNNKPEAADGSVCSRLCSPAVTHDQAQDASAGNGGNCDLASLSATGGTNGANSAHQCRFIQSFYGGTEMVPAALGMCVPVNSPLGGTWGDCTKFEWNGIKTAWNDAVSAETDPNAALNLFCYGTETPDASEPLSEKCLGLRVGCLDLDTRASELSEPSGMSFATLRQWRDSLGWPTQESLNELSMAVD